MTSIVGTGMSMTYNYSATKNNGQITSSVDNAHSPAETVTYQYDALKRLVQADGLNWTEGYVYDGYGNLLQMNPTGTTNAPTMNLTVALDSNGVPTNRISASGVSYDNNGNQTAGFAGLSLTYDLANRLATVGGSQSATYGYDSENRRIYSRNASGAETIYFYGADGTKLAAYTPTIVQEYGNQGPLVVQLTQQSENVYFLGKLISAEGNSVTTDRLGSVCSGGPGNLGYQAQYPYGVEYSPLTANDREKYATYTRDSATGLDYAMNRYYASQWGRFLSPDPYLANTGGAGDPANPQSWNRYAYAQGDPVNANDSRGLFVCIVGVGPIGEGSEYAECDIDTEPVPEPDPEPSPAGGAFKSKFGPCNPNNVPGLDNELSFIVKNDKAAQTVAGWVNFVYNLQFTASDVLGWAGEESGWGTNGESKANNYFGMATGGNWILQTCPNSGPCFDSFQDSAVSAFFSPLKITGYPSAVYGLLNDQSAGFILQDQLNQGASLGAAFQAVASGGTAKPYGWNSANPNYGNDIASAIQPVQSHIDCLQKNGYLH